MNRVNISGVFRNTTNSYKYYWWLAIIEICVDSKKKRIYFDEIIFKVISKIWFPVNYFKLSFGKQDRCSKFIQELKQAYNLKDNIKEHELNKYLTHYKHSELLQKIADELTKYAPFRFIRPWYANKLRGIKDNKVNSSILKYQDSSSPYIIDIESKMIVLNNYYYKLIQNQHGILISHINFELIKFLEKQNPNVTGLTKKLIRPQNRNLNKQMKIWTKFICINGSSIDLFGGQTLKSLEHTSIDHFMPWSFCTHDLLWNLHPIEKKINSKKNNSFPSQDYIDPFTELQYNFFTFLLSNDWSKSLLDYVDLFQCSLENLKQINKSDFKEKLSNYIYTRYEVARNMGFQMDWVFK